LKILTQLQNFVKLTGRLLNPFSTSTRVNISNF